MTNRFAYSVYFVLEADVVVVLRILHQARDPREWKRSSRSIHRATSFLTRLLDWATADSALGFREGDFGPGEGGVVGAVFDANVERNVAAPRLFGDVADRVFSRPSRDTLGSPRPPGPSLDARGDKPSAFHGLSRTSPRPAVTSGWFLRETDLGSVEVVVVAAVIDAHERETNAAAPRLGFNFWEGFTDPTLTRWAT